MTLLYDCQSVTEIADFIDGRLARGDTSGDAEQAAQVDNWMPRISSAINVQEPDRPSKLLKTLRCGKFCACFPRLSSGERWA